MEEEKNEKNLNTEEAYLIEQNKMSIEGKNLN
jgi:hypothetical protein